MAEHLLRPICSGREVDRYEAAQRRKGREGRMCRIMEVNLMDDERLARSLADGMGMIVA